MNQVAAPGASVALTKSAAERIRVLAASQMGTLAANIGNNPHDVPWPDLTKSARWRAAVRRVNDVGRVRTRTRVLTRTTTA